MSLNSTPTADRIHIGLFGKRNAGKSSVINAITGQNIAIVSDMKGTTTDPVYKAMELLPLGPVMLIDTPGIDDEGILGELRIQKAKQVLNKTDIALLIIDGTLEPSEDEIELIELIEKKGIPYIIVKTKLDLYRETNLCDNLIMNQWEEENSKIHSTITDIEKSLQEELSVKEIWISAKTGENIFLLKECIGKLAQNEESKTRIVGDFISPSDFIVLVVPIDKAAPKGRLILPQQQTIRDILDSDATAIVVKEYDLKNTLETLGKKPKLVITDSQVFATVAKDTPKDILLTSFSILFARYKGNLEEAVKGAKAIDQLENGDSILISEGCTHHRQCDDIGTVKIPRWIRKYTEKEFDFHFSSGTEFPEDLLKYKLVIHCGGCMLNEREMKYRLRCAIDQHIPITNYGILIAYMNGILKRSVEVFPTIAKELK